MYKGPLIATVLLISGCTLTPSYQTPASPVADTLGETRAMQEDPQPLTPAQPLFNDPQLQQLVELAVDNNRELQAALLEVAALRAQYRIQGSERLPSLALEANGQRQRLPADLSPGGDSSVQSQYGVQVGLVAWELDLFGRLGSLNEAALARYLASESAQQATRLAVIAQVADSYLALQASQRNLAISEDTLRAQQASFELLQHRFQAGIGNELQWRQAQTLLETARVQAAHFEQQQHSHHQALTRLVGLPQLPTALLNPAHQADPDDAAMAAILAVPVPAGLPSSILLQRPDVQQAEQQLIAANADIGAARAALFPRISLTGSAGTASSELSGLFEGGSGTWSFAPQIHLPIFTGGRNRANLELARVREQQALNHYQHTLQVAFEEVANRLHARDTLQRQQQAQAALVEASEATVLLAQRRFEQGADNYLAVLDAERNLLNARQQKVDLEQLQQSNEIALYRALGGAWQSTPVATR